MSHTQQSEVTAEASTTQSDKLPWNRPQITVEEVQNITRATFTGTNNDGFSFCAS